MAEHAELLMTVMVLVLLGLGFAVVWFVFVTPMEKGLHARRMDLIQKRLQQHEQRLRAERRINLPEPAAKSSPDRSRVRDG